MATGESSAFFAKKDHDLSEEEKRQIRERIDHGDSEVYKLSTEFNCAPIQIAGIKAAMQRAKSGPTTTAIEISGDIDKPEDRERFLNHLLSSAKARAREAGMPFDLDDSPGFVAGLYETQRGLCAVSRLKFNLTSFPEALVKHPYAPSIDRVLSSGGYTKDNVRLVCVAVNFGLGQWGEEVYLTLARSAVDYERQQETKEEAVPAGAVIADDRTGQIAVGKECATLQERLDAAVKLLPLLPAGEQEK